MDSVIKGTVHKFGDNVDTDAIIPARYLNDPDPAALAAHCMEDIDADFANNVKESDIIVAGRNFGCGSSREHAPVAIKASGVSCVIAASFARIFFRNAVNTGLPILECERANEIEQGDVLTADFAAGEIINHTKGQSYATRPQPPFITEIIDCGGLINYTRERLAGR